ncbi:hypothetical protein Bca4012_022187 [Brassica carinata]|uniref:HTH La-type RNA-binding domain-containing protein n=1 Tax=Brassica carinata TaxID=52824 RepID=A0A8X7P414_BRACI|nr:hypothetical protein Bca52824_094632 [Brassica carinata]
MASAATNNNSTSSSTSSENRGSPAQSRRPSPWSQIVRGESEPTTISSAAAPSSPQPKAPIDPVASASVAPLLPAAAGDDGSEGSGGAQGNAGKKPVWKRPSNGDASSEVGPVMGASSWPALSETTTKAPSNKSSSDSLKSLGDVPSSSSVVVPLSQGNANASVPARGRANPNQTPNHSRQRSFKRNGASGSAGNGTVSQPSAQGPLVETHSHNPSPRGQNQKNGGFASQTHGGGSDNNFSPRDSSYRNQNGNHHHHHQSHGGGRRNQEHGNQNWTFNRSFNGRDGNAHSQRGAPAFVRHPPPPMQSIPPQFMAAQPMQPFGSPVPFPPELASPYYPRMPFMGPLSPGPVYYQVQDPPLNIKLQKQIHYYFSEENLIRDTYLRGHMDDQGFVPLHVIAGFKKVAELTDSIQQIVEALQGSPFVEVQGDRIRKRYNWQHWLLPEEASPRSVGAVASGVRNLSIGQSSADPIGGSSSQLQPAEAKNKAASDGQQQFSVVGQVNNINDSDGANR